MVETPCTAAVPVPDGMVIVPDAVADGDSVVVPDDEPLSVRALVKLSVVIVAVPLTVNNVLGELVPIPMLPKKTAATCVAVPATVRAPYTLVVPIPTPPPLVTN